MNWRMTHLHAYLVLCRLWRQHSEGMEHCLWLRGETFGSAPASAIGSVHVV